MNLHSRYLTIIFKELLHKGSLNLFTHKTRFTSNLRWILVFLIFSASTSSMFSQKILHDFTGEWKFKVGDNLQWAKVEYDDRSWKEIAVPSAWEDQGLPGYDGFGWYRSVFTASTEWSKFGIYFELGRIDDVDEVYLNGELLGSTGSFPPLYETAYQHKRKYYVPFYKLNMDSQNTIAIRVYDDRLMGGILEGRTAVVGHSEIVPDIDLAGYWNFKKGDDLRWALPHTSDEEWTKILVPKPWDEQGLTHYDGFGWYSIRFEFSGFETDQELVLSLGKIDDIDQVWLNGVLIGETGIMPSEFQPFYSDYDYLKHRFYPIPRNLLNSYSENYIAIRVFDAEYTGGIYEGPIGIYTKSRAELFNRENNELDPWKLFKNFLGW